MQPGTLADQASQLKRDGYVRLPGLFGPAAVEQARQRVLKHLHLLKNTRPNRSAGHLAGFHRYPELEPLHLPLSGHGDILGVLGAATDDGAVRTIGLSDITINRSQEWHVDLLRGAYRRHLTAEMCWGPSGGGVYKVLWYLQDGRSLQVVAGAHTVPLELNDDRASEPRNGASPRAIAMKAGDVILMDIRLPHRGSTERELSDGAFLKAPKILISTVLGASTWPLTGAMERGNGERLSDWDRAHRHRGPPVLG